MVKKNKQFEKQALMLIKLLEKSLWNYLMWMKWLVLKKH